MKKPLFIHRFGSIVNLLKYADKAVTEDGKTYYCFPYWFEPVGDNFELLMHEDLPEDLSRFICKAGIGQPNPQVQKGGL